MALTSVVIDIDDVIKAVTETISTATWSTETKVVDGRTDHLIRVAGGS